MTALSLTGIRGADWLIRNHIWVFLVLAIAFFANASPFFLTVNNLGNVLTQAAFIGILAVGMTMVMINGEIDLSVGATLALASALAIGLQPAIGVWPAVFVGFLSGAALGALNGTLVALSGMHSFIVTLGGLIGIRGLVFVYTGEQALMVQDFAYTDIPEVYLGPLSLTAMIFLALAALFQWVLTSTRHGRETYAVGDNIDAAHDAGTRSSISPSAARWRPSRGFFCPCVWARLNRTRAGYGSCGRSSPWCWGARGWRAAMAACG